MVNSTEVLVHGVWPQRTFWFRKRFGMVVVGRRPCIVIEHDAFPEPIEIVQPRGSEVLSFGLQVIGVFRTQGLPY